MADEPAREDDPLPYNSTPGVRLHVPALISMILGIIAIPADIAFFAGTVLGFVAILLGMYSIATINKSPDLKGKSFALAGIILGIVSWLVAIGCGLLVFGGPW